MEGATATFAMFVPEPVAPADLGIAQAYYEVCVPSEWWRSCRLPEEDKLEMYLIQDYFADGFCFLKVTTKICKPPHINIVMNKLTDQAG
jgi:hypothetical protein